MKFPLSAELLKDELTFASDKISYIKKYPLCCKNPTEALKGWRIRIVELNEELGRLELE